MLQGGPTLGIIGRAGVQILSVNSVPNSYVTTETGGVSSSEAEVRTSFTFRVERAKRFVIDDAIPVSYLRAQPLRPS